MIVRTLSRFVSVLLLGLLPLGFVSAGGANRGGGALGGGVGAAGTGSAAIGGGAPAGQVGGGAPAGAVGGGTPGAGNPAGNGAAGTGNPSLNALGAGSSGNNTNTPGIPNATTRGSEFGGGVGIVGGASASYRAGGAAPNPTGAEPSADGSKQQGPAVQERPAPPQRLEDQAFSPTGLSTEGPDGASTIIVSARPCGLAAHETDGFTTCVGIPKRRGAVTKHQ
jgi:hypothetical protein